MSKWVRHVSILGDELLPACCLSCLIYPCGFPDPSCRVGDIVGEVHPIDLIGKYPGLHRIYCVACLQTDLPEFKDRLLHDTGYRPLLADKLVVVQSLGRSGAETQGLVPVFLERGVLFAEDDFFAYPVLRGSSTVAHNESDEQGERQQGKASKTRFGGSAAVPHVRLRNTGRDRIHCVVPQARFLLSSAQTSATSSDMA